MSAFIVADETINKIVYYLHVKALGDSIPSELGLTKLPKAEFDLTTEEGTRQLADEMFFLNVAAVNAKYGEGEAKKFRPLDFLYTPVPSNQIAVIKALESWSYQCTEGNIPQTKIYKVMEDVHCALCVDYVHGLEEWEAAQWE